MMQSSSIRKVERCIFIDLAHKDFEKSIEGYDRVYFGGEHCENMIPSHGMLNKVYRICRNKLTLVLPIVSEKGIEKIKQLIPLLDSFIELEVVFNDWGVFQLLRPQKNIKMIQGRVLTRQIKDPNLSYVVSNMYQKSGSKVASFMNIHAKINSVPKETAEYYSEVAENGIYLQRFLKDCGISRIELDYLCCGLRLTLPAWLKASVYFPEICLTVSRNCEFKSGYSGDCGLCCLKRKTRLKSSIPGFPALFLKGNRLCYSVLGDKDSFLKAVRNNDSIDRIIVNQKRSLL